MSADLDDLAGEAAASEIVALHDAKKAAGRRHGVGGDQQRVNRLALVDRIELLTEESLDPIRHGDSIAGCVHYPNDAARRSSSAAADAACGAGRDRTPADRD